MKSFFVTLILVLATPLLVFAYTSPGKPTGFVNDFAKILQASDIQAVNSQLSSFKDSSGVDVVVVTIPSLGDEVIENYAVKLFEEWGIGTKGKDGGLLILVAPNDRVAKIEVGYGLEGIVTDLQAGNIIDKVMIPAFKANDYLGGIKGAVDATIAIITKSPDAAIFSEPANKSFSVSGRSFETILFFIFLIGSILAGILGKTKSWWLGGVIGAGAGLIVSLIWGFLYYGLGAIILFTIIGLVFDFIVSKHGPGDGKGGGIFPFIMGGGHGSGGFGGGGFGGFGGGMSGGGGASGRW